MKHQKLIPIDGEALRTIRNRRQLRQADVAALAGIDTSYLCMLETGRRSRASHAVASRIAAAMTVPLASIIDENQQEVA